MSPVGQPRRLFQFPVQIALVAFALAASFLLGCETNQIKPPADPNAVVWTRLTDPNQVDTPLYPDWHDSTIAFQYTYTIVPGLTNSHLGVIKEDRSGQQLYTELGSTFDFFPRWVSDTLIVYSSNKGSPGGQYFPIWYRYMNSNTTRNLGQVDINELQPAPRPGLPSLAYTAGNNIFQGRITLIPDVTDTLLTRLPLTPDTLQAGEPDWDPSGNRLCFSADDPNGSRNIWLMTMSGTSVVSMRRVTTDAVHDLNPRFSPDGTKIAFRSDRSGKSGIWWVSPDSGGVHLVAFADAGTTALQPCWSPDGKEIVVSSDIQGKRALWILSNLGF